MTKHGVPMEELNGTKKLAQESTPLNQAGRSLPYSSMACFSLATKFPRPKLLQNSIRIKKHKISRIP